MTDSASGRLADRTEILVDASFAAARPDPALAADVYDRAIELGLGRELEEVLLQSYLFVGFPRALEALAAWRAHSGSEPAPATEDDLGLWQERGVRVCRAVYGEAYGPLRERMRQVHPDLDRWMIGEGYGKVLGRPGVPLVDRELAVVATLIALSAPRQLHSHLRGALEVGAEVDTVAAVVDRCCRRISTEAAAEVQRVWAAVEERRRARAHQRPVQPAHGETDR